ncbi:MAG: amino acid transporter [Betaproteobacteria bacterium]|nr:amino acid transporter [Betaproteobacteria bacterium]
MNVARIRQALIGKPLDPLSADARHGSALIAFLAWVGLGADGLSSASYGPEESFLSLGGNTGVGLYLVIATVVTVFIIALAYNQVIELFPTGGGGYRVATSLIGPYPGLVSGVALILDYVLTIAISMAAGVDALFSLLPTSWQGTKLFAEGAFIVFILVLNLRGLKEAIQVLLPIFLGFIITHALLLVYGIAAHVTSLPALVPATLSETSRMAGSIGVLPLIGLLLVAYSQGGGTYTGLEAVSNNVNVLAEPRVKTGKVTMFYMAVSLAVTAGGIILLYLLWGVQPKDGQTLNAVVFGQIIGNLGMSAGINQTLLTITLAFEAGLLFVAANTGFLGGPAVLSNMALDSWLPHQFRYLSQRLVTQNGILVLGVAALGILLWTRGSVTLLVVLYSISVFLTFAISLFGLMIYWWRHRGELEHWRRRMVLSAIGFFVCASIFLVLVVQKFADGAWLAILIIAALCALCIWIRHHYDETRRKIGEIDKVFGAMPELPVNENPPALEPDAPTAVFFVGSSRGGALHTLLWVQRIFPGHFKNFLFVNARTVDVRSYGGEDILATLKKRASESLDYLVRFCHANGMASRSYAVYGTDPVTEITNVANKIRLEYPNAIFFTSKLIFENENWVTRILHNQAALALQRRLHLEGMQMVILGMKI